ncbi:MAG: hypothetical protein ACLFQQ_22695, partial [Desulfococcaceae bacterium]
LENNHRIDSGISAISESLRGRKRESPTSIGVCLDGLIFAGAMGEMAMGGKKRFSGMGSLGGRL